MRSVAGNVLRRWTPHSLTARVVLLSSILTLFALATTGSIVVAIYERAASENFDQLLNAQRFSLIGAIGLSDDGQLTGAPQIGDLRYEDNRSGWYWEVRPVNGDSAGGDMRRSPALAGDVPDAPLSVVPFDAFFERSYIETAPDGRLVRVAESELQLAADAPPYRFRVMGNETAFRQEIADFRAVVFFWLIGLGLILVAINAAAVRYGLQPLHRVRTALSDIRSGRRQRLDGEFPLEISPLTAEINALIEANHAIVDRARTQVGNLAHSLKTPLSVLTNEANAMDRRHGRLVAEQAAAMRDQVEHYLQRARIAAQRNALGQRTEVAPALERLLRVIRKITPDRDVAARIDGEPTFAGEVQDLEEMVGNLLENAVKWSRHRIIVEAKQSVRDGRPLVTIGVEDDGPGIPADQAEEAVKRGRRLDETVPGTGLGLSIVSETAGEYGGRLELGESRLGGLRARLELPAAGFTSAR